MEEPKEFIIPFGLICKDRDPLAFMSQELESLGWLPTPFGFSKRTGDEGYVSGFWVSPSKLNSFKKDVSYLCIPFGLSQEHHSNYILLGN